MQRRGFLKTSLATVLMLGLGATTTVGAEAPTAQLKSYKKLSHLAVFVGRKGDKRTRLVFSDNTPQRIPGAKTPTAISFEEHEDDSVRMNIFAVGKDGKFKFLDHYYAGVASTQHIGGGVGVTLVLVPNG